MRRTSASPLTRKTVTHVMRCISLCTANSRDPRPREFAFTWEPLWRRRVLPGERERAGGVRGCGKKPEIPYCRREARLRYRGILPMHARISFVECGPVYRGRRKGPARKRKGEGGDDISQRSP